MANSKYFWVVDQLIVPGPGVPAIRELARSGDITSVGIRCEDRDPGAAAAIGE